LIPDNFCIFSMASLTQLKKPVGPTSAEVDERKELNKKQTKKESNGKTLNEEDKARLEFLKVKSKQFKRDMEEYEALTKELGVARRDQKVCCLFLFYLYNLSISLCHHRSSHKMTAVWRGRSTHSSSHLNFPKLN
jgi:hypothetical protein